MASSAPSRGLHLSLSFLSARVRTIRLVPFPFPSGIASSHPRFRRAGLPACAARMRRAGSRRAPTPGPILPPAPALPCASRFPSAMRRAAKTSRLRRTFPKRPRLPIRGRFFVSQAHPPRRTSCAFHRAPRTNLHTSRAVHNAHAIPWFRPTGKDAPCNEKHPS